MDFNYNKKYNIYYKNIMIHVLKWKLNYYGNQQQKKGRSGTVENTISHVIVK